MGEIEQHKTLCYFAIEAIMARMIDFIDLSSQQTAIAPYLEPLLREVFAKNTYVGGDLVEELTSRLSTYTQSQVITCANGTDALVLALKAIGVKPGDAVLVPAFTFVASAEAIAILGAVPVFCDVDPQTFNISLKTVEAAFIDAVEQQALLPKALVAVDLFGAPAPYDQLIPWCHKHSIHVIGDAAQSFGSRVGERQAVALPDIAATSFFPSKPLGCYGDGGAVVTQNTDWAQTIRSLCTHGKDASGSHIHIGMNSRLDALQAAVLLAKLEVFDEELKQRNENARFYTSHLESLVQPQLIMPQTTSAWAQYSCLLPPGIDRSHFQQELLAFGVPTRVYYETPLHQMPAFLSAVKRAKNLDVSEQLSERIVSFPVHPYLSIAQLHTVADSVAKVIAKRGGSA